MEGSAADLFLRAGEREARAWVPAMSIELVNVRDWARMVPVGRELVQKGNIRILRKLTETQSGIYESVLNDIRSLLPNDEHERTLTVTFCNPFFEYHDKPVS